MPEVDVLLEARVIGGGNPRGDGLRDQPAPWLQPTIPSQGNDRKEVLVQGITAEPLGNDDIDLLRERGGLHVVLNHSDALREAIVRDDASRQLRNRRAFDGIDHPGPCLRRKQTQDAGTGADIEYRATRRYGVEDGAAKRLAPYRILQHPLVTS